MKSRPVFRDGPLELRGLRLEIVDAQWSASGIRLHFIVPDRDTGEPAQLVFEDRWNGADFAGLPQDEISIRVVHSIRVACREVVAHELAELVLMHGRRDDPHAADSFRRSAVR